MTNKPIFSQYDAKHDTRFTIWKQKDETYSYFKETPNRLFDRYGLTRDEVYKEYINWCEYWSVEPQVIGW